MGAGSVIDQQGFVYSGKEAKLEQILTELKVGWFYTWNNKRPETVTKSLSFTPMVFSKRISTDETIMTRLSEQNIQGIGNQILGFNEPDREDQSNLTIDEAINQWKQLQKTGQRLGSPAVAQNAVTGEWLAEFMTKAKENGLKIDFIAIHWYKSPDPEKFFKYIDEIYDKYKLPIWITQFAVADWNSQKQGVRTQHSLEVVKEFMKQVIPRLYKHPNVERFAWKTRNTSDLAMATSALLNDDLSLTELGQLYASLQPPVIASEGVKNGSENSCENIPTSISQSQ